MSLQRMLMAAVSIALQQIFNGVEDDSIGSIWEAIFHLTSSLSL